MAIANESVKALPGTTNLTLNNTTSAPAPYPILAQWTLEPAFFLAVAVIGLLLNGVTIAAFVRTKALLTSFNIYVAHLIFLNVIACLLQYPLAIMNSVYSYRWVLGNHACNWFLFVHTMLNAGTVNTHAIIAINRTWALLHPISYRNYHKTTFAYRTLIGLWVYFALIAGINWAIDVAVYQKNTAIFGCQFSVTEYSPVNVILVYTLPVVVVLVSCPIICARKIVIFAHGQVQRLRSFFSAAGADRSVAPLPDVADVTRQQVSSNVEVPKTEPVVVGKAAARDRVKSARYHVLILLTFSVTVCYLPEITFYLCLIFVRNFWMPVLYNVTSVLYAFQTIADPLLFIASLENLRNGVLRLLTIRSR